MTDKATHSPSPSLYEKIERYGAYRFAHGHNEANRHYDIADREKANAAAMLSEILAEVERLAAQAAPTEAEYNPLLIDGVQHDPLCLKVYRSPLKECDCGASSRAAQPPQAPVVQAVQAREYPPGARLWVKKPLTVQAAQWFKNGDHPQDYAADTQGFENGELRVFTGAERKANGWEGSVVRYYRHPDVPGEKPCEQCGKPHHVHGWIDTLEQGHRVCPGDWIITGVKGERYPCKPDIFATTYAPAAQPSQAPVVQAVPVNCGTGYCSCIECVVEPDRASSGRAQAGQTERIEAPDFGPMPTIALGIEAAAQPLKAEQAKDAAEDAELLEWLEEKHYALHPIKEDQGDDTYTLWWQVTDKDKSISGHPLGNIRAAIRAARAAERKA